MDNNPQLDCVKIKADILKQKSYVLFTFRSVDSKHMNAFHSNTHITRFHYLAKLCIKIKFIW